MALRFPAKKKPNPQKPVAHPDPHVSMGDGGQGNFQPDAASQETFHLEMDLHQEELSLLKKLSEQFVRMLGGITPRALPRPRPRAPLPRPRKPKAAGRKATSVRRKAARRR